MEHKQHMIRNDKEDIDILVEDIVEEEKNKVSDWQQPYCRGNDRGIYQCALFFLTQIGFLVVTPSMLSTTFFEPSQSFCEEFRRSSGEVMSINLSGPSIDGNDAASLHLPAVAVDGRERQFHSILMEWNEHCHGSPWTIWVSTAVMVGAITGSFIAGYVADRFGRKPVVAGSMLSASLGNGLLSLFGAFDLFLTLVLFFFVGLACGGYMVTNMVLVIETLHQSTSRLFVVSLNGWPIGMIGTAFLAYFLQQWHSYHLCISLLAFIFFLALQCFTFESIPWLIQTGHAQRANLIQKNLHKINSSFSRVQTPFEKTNMSYMKKEMHHLNNISTENSRAADEHIGFDTPQNTYTYLDLFRHRSIRFRLMALLFCFASSSVVSFGLYFSAEALPGSRYTNIAFMGLGKLLLGILPFILSNLTGRRPIMLVSVGLSGLACWSLLIGWLFFDLSRYWIITALGLFVTGMIDPNWKIIHLYSMELFPTPVRNMARALCNVTARLGSLSGPWVLFLRSFNELLPFWVFSISLTVQWILSFCFLPETSKQPLPQQMPPTDVDSDHQ